MFHESSVCDKDQRVAHQYEKPHVSTRDKRTCNASMAHSKDQYSKYYGVVWSVGWFPPHKAIDCSSIKVGDPRFRLGVPWFSLPPPSLRRVGLGVFQEVRGPCQLAAGIALTRLRLAGCMPELNLEQTKTQGPHPKSFNHEAEVYSISQPSSHPTEHPTVREGWPSITS